ncbi:MAG: putative oxidoreductase [Planctomycetota bacterium]|jgi:predicted oxidoreductase
MTASSTISSHDIVVGLWRLAYWDLQDQALVDWTRQVLDLGVDTFDLADVYGGYRCEEIFGNALRADPGLRDKLRIITKCDIKIVSERRPEHRRHVYDTSKRHIVASAEASLRQLGTDRLDLLLIHRQDPLMDPAEVAAAFDELHSSGKVLTFGVSNFTPSHLSMLASYVQQPLVTNQVEASVLCLSPFQDGTIDQCLERRMRPMAWSPLGGGQLMVGEAEQAQRVRAALEPIAEQHGCAIDAIAMAFLMRHPAAIHPITGTSRVDRIRSAIDACELRLSREQWFEIWCASTGASLP